MSDFKSFVIRNDKKDSFCDALADVLCWLDGFQAGGGTYSPGSTNTLRDLRDTIERAYDSIPPQDKIEALSKAIADELFTPCGGRVVRLVHETAKTKLNGPGMCREAVEETVARILSKHLK